jgi:hypothetical protein
MPKAEPHFDAPALLEAVHQQDIGLRISTNNAESFMRIVYAAGRANPARRVHIHRDPRSVNSLFLLKKGLTPESKA